jgi:hypothetical protein
MLETTVHTYFFKQCPRAHGHSHAQKQAFLKATQFMKRSYLKKGKMCIPITAIITPETPTFTVLKYHPNH